MDKLNTARLKQFGQHLQQLRKEKGLSLRELALKSDGRSQKKSVI